MSEVIQKTCTKKHVVIEARAVIDPPHLWHWLVKPEEKTPENYAKLLEEWAMDVKEKTGLRLHVDKTYQTQCSACNREYEADVHDDGSEHCAWCGALLEVVR